MLSLLNLQIIIDLVFFVTILILLSQLNKNISKNSSTVDTSLIQELEKIVTESYHSTNRFIEAIDESKQVLNKLFLQLDDKGKKLTVLIGEAEMHIKKLDLEKNVSEPVSSEKRYDDVIQMVQQGMSREEVSKRLGFTEGEIGLIVDLARTRTGCIS
ncbi:MAG: DUF2802 domain-containing protein [Deltaproteobacteria bacterium]|nr:DUF2802 domain-containing protein [Deltaproteobacteria bacterium]